MADKERFAQARALIVEKRFAEARTILNQLQHPMATKWLAQLDQVEAAAATTASQSAASPTPDEGDEVEVVETGRMDTTDAKTLLVYAKELITAKKYDEARAILGSINHPTVQKWLEKLNQIAPPTAPKESLPRDAQEEKLIEAQELILASEFAAAKVILNTLTIPEAETWRDKTQMNKFGEFQSLWLDMYTYGVDLSARPNADINTWQCPTCKRIAKQVGQCPQRGTPFCPARIIERAIEEPHRIALVLGAIHMGDTGNIKTMLKTADAAKINRWRAYLEQNLAHMWARDVRRPTYETAIILLGQLAESRKLQGMVGDESAAPGLESIAPLESQTQDTDNGGDPKSQRKRGRLFGKK